MMSWAITLLIIALIAGVLGFSGVMGTAIHIAWILGIIAVVLFIVNAVAGRRVA